ncbi:response regulator [Hespellia stercorisuis]|uniref:Stage 0 sporulation protein A homolog n=1 Tax=Hespellia stercorisuis DSM 15480 TaxID=1121950 RepID=A0A1M6M657_9FIRM|nr:response regulator [Hespellia stercorisuis]SHJ78941.1 two-component system, response regulator YesN [Hespellia stercorisuis DSM 15480]
MIKVLVCDDEGIVRQSLRFIMNKAFGEECRVSEAKSGREAIELTQSVRPDVAFMDIQMPGINGIEAMKEMKRENPNMQFIVLTAYDKFCYAKESIDLGVLEFLTKPISRDKVVEVLRRAMNVVEEHKKKKSQELEVREKLETVIPMIENGFIYNVILQDEGCFEETGYENLLDIQGKHGYMIVVEFGDDRREGSMTKPVGSNVKMQKYYQEFREIVKEFLDCVIGAPMSNKVMICVPTEQTVLEYDDRVKVIETARGMIRKLEQRISLKFKMGIGSLKPMTKIGESYREAVAAVRQSIGKVTHIRDIPAGCSYETEYPLEVEELIFESLGKGNADVLRVQCEKFVVWMEQNTPELDNNVRLKAVEFVLRAEEQAYRHGGMVYKFRGRDGFLEEVLECDSYESLMTWFMTKMLRACSNVKSKQKEKNTSIVEKAKEYITEHYASELSLDEISREVNISPYYFSKLFKEETGGNYIEYVTKTRIEEAKKLLMNPENSIKSICVEVGYSDPNYFSRLFKKSVGKTPSEFREEINYE